MVPHTTLAPMTALSSITPWRLIPYLDLAGSYQMAIDTWLLDYYVPQSGRSVLRFYGWSPIAISLGYFQTQIPDHWQGLCWQGQGLDLVRRPSGGRAVLHQGSLTYGVIMPRREIPRRQLYTHVCQFLLQGWRSLGIELTFGHAGRGYIHNDSCFNTATSADLVAIDGSKLIGSAQRKTQNAVLQHGSMLLNGDRQLYETIFAQPVPWSQGLSEGSRPQSLTDILVTLTQAAEACFQAEMSLEPLTSQEWRQIKTLESSGDCPQSLYQASPPILPEL